MFRWKALPSQQFNLPSLRHLPSPFLRPLERKKTTIPSSRNFYSYSRSLRTPNYFGSSENENFNKKEESNKNEENSQKSNQKEDKFNLKNESMEEKTSKKKDDSQTEFSTTDVEIDKFVEFVKKQRETVSHFKGFQIGFLSSAFGGMVGMGGGNFSAPLLMMNRLTGLEARKAIGTTSVVILTTGAIGSLSYWWNGNGFESLDVLAAIILAITSIPMAHVGLRIVYHIQQDHLRILLGLLMLFSIPLVLLKGFLEDSAEEKKEEEKSSKETGSFELRSIYEKSCISDWKKSTALLGIGSISGILSGLFGVGGGIIMVPLMSLFLPQEVAQGTSLLAMLPPTMIAGYAHLKKNNIHKGYVPSLIAGSVFGAWLAGYSINQLDDLTLRVVYCIIIAYLSYKTFKPQKVVKITEGQLQALKMQGLLRKKAPGPKS